VPPRADPEAALGLMLPALLTPEPTRDIVLTMTIPTTVLPGDLETTNLAALPRGFLQGWEWAGSRANLVRRRKHREMMRVSTGTRTTEGQV